MARFKKIIFVLFIVMLFTLTSCGGERTEVESLINDLLEHKGYDLDKGYCYSYIVVYNVNNNKSPSKYYMVNLYNGWGEIKLYKGMFDNGKN